MKIIKDAPKSKSYPKVDAVIDQMETEYPETMGEFRKIQEEQYKSFAKKQLSNGPTSVSVGTQLCTDEEIRLSLLGLFFKLNDKIQHVKTLVLGTRDDIDKGLEDSYLDISNYGIMAAIVKRGKWGK